MQKIELEMMRPEWAKPAIPKEKPRERDIPEIPNPIKPSIPTPGPAEVPPSPRPPVEVPRTPVPV